MFVPRKSIAQKSCSLLYFFNNDTSFKMYYFTHRNHSSLITIRLHQIIFGIDVVWLACNESNRLPQFAYGLGRSD